MTKLCVVKVENSFRTLLTFDKRAERMKIETSRRRLHAHGFWREENVFIR